LYAADLTNADSLILEEDPFDRLMAVFENNEPTGALQSMELRPLNIFDDDDLATAPIEALLWLYLSDDRVKCLEYGNIDVTRHVNTYRLRRPLNVPMRQCLSCQQVFNILAVHEEDSDNCREIFQIRFVIINFICSERNNATFTVFNGNPFVVENSPPLVATDHAVLEPDDIHTADTLRDHPLVVENLTTLVAADHAVLETDDTHTADTLRDHNSDISFDTDQFQ